MAREERGRSGRGSASGWSGRLTRLLTRASFALGAAALLAAMGVNFADVVTRHLGLRLLGAIEVVQLCIVAVISSAIVLATAAGAHAAVHLVTSRLHGRLRRGLEMISEGFTALAFATLLLGDGWILVDLWPLDERSDLLGLPTAPARALWCASLAFAALLAAAAITDRPNLPAETEPNDDL